MAHLSRIVKEPYDFEERFREWYKGKEEGTHEAAFTEHADAPLL